MVIVACTPCITSAAAPAAASALTYLGYRSYKKKPKRPKKSKKSKKPKKPKKQKGGISTQEENEQRLEEEQQQLQEHNKFLEEMDQKQKNCNTHLSDGFKFLLDREIEANKLEEFAKESYDANILCKHNKYDCNICEELRNKYEEIAPQFPPKIPEHIKNAINPSPIYLSDLPPRESMLLQAITRRREEDRRKMFEKKKRLSNLLKMGILETGSSKRRSSKRRSSKRRSSNRRSSKLSRARSNPLPGGGKRRQKTRKRGK